MTIELHTPAPTSLDAKIRYAQTLAEAKLLPAAYRNSPANVLLATELGEALGIPAIQAINSIHVIEGKPTASADLIASLVRRAGHKLRITETQDATGPVVTARLIRADDPDFTFEATWDTTKAKTAGLGGKGNWAKYPGQMMRNRAITEVCRQGAGDALYGVIYTAEELDAETTEVRQVPVPEAPKRGPVSLADVIAESEPEADWQVRIDALATPDEARALWAEAKHAGAPAEVLEEITVRGRGLTSAEILEAEVVSDDTAPWPEQPAHIPSDPSEPAGVFSLEAPA